MRFSVQSRAASILLFLFLRLALLNRSISILNAQNSTLTKQFYLLFSILSLQGCIYSYYSTNYLVRQGRLLSDYFIIVGYTLKILLLFQYKARSDLRKLPMILFISASIDLRGDSLIVYRLANIGNQLSPIVVQKALVSFDYVYLIAIRLELSPNTLLEPY